MMIENQHATFGAIAFGAVGWAICGASIAIGFAVTSEFGALVLHAIAAPVIFAALSWLYFRRFAYVAPLRPAVLFVAVAISLDVVIVALLVERSFEMFESILGMWLPFGLIFAASWATGWLVRKHASAPDTGHQPDRFNH